MAIFGGAWDVAVAIFLVLVFAEYVKIRAKANKQFNWIAAGGVLALLAGASPWIGVLHAGAGNILGMLFGVIGYILVLIGALWAAAELLKAK